MTNWYVLVRVNPATPEGYYPDGNGNSVFCNAVPETISPIYINTNKAYLESFLKNGGNFRIIEVKYELATSSI